VVGLAVTAGGLVTPGRPPGFTWGGRLTTAGGLVTVGRGLFTTGGSGVLGLAAGWMAGGRIAG
jgi:hypothetical protein